MGELSEQEPESRHFELMWDAHFGEDWGAAAGYALQAADMVGVRSPEGAAVIVAQAQVYATLALVEQQRVANKLRAVQIEQLGEIARTTASPGYAQDPAVDVRRYLARGGTETWKAVHAEKAGHGRDFTNAMMQHGKDREPIIARFAQSMFGLYSSRALLGWNQELRFMATPDLLGAGKFKVGDIKTTVHDWETVDDVPGRYVDQLLWQMLVTGEKVAALVYEPHENGVPLYPMPKMLPIEWDSARVHQLQATAYEFLNEDDEPDEDAAIIDALLTDAAMRKELADAAAQSYQQAVAAIEAHLQGKPRRFSGSVASLARSADGISKTFDRAAFKKDHPDLDARYERTAPRKGALRITIHTDDQEQTGEAA